jgi:hypothetical protein
VRGSTENREEPGATPLRSLPPLAPGDPLANKGRWVIVDPHVGIALTDGGHAMAEKQGRESETVAPGRSGTSRWRGRASIVGGTAAGIALLAALAFLVWPKTPGQVVFRVQPEDASVWLYGDQGRYQLEPAAGSPTATLPAGAHRAEVEREGYTSRELELEVEGGETHTIDVMLERAVGTVVFEVEPTTAEVEFVSTEEVSPAQNLPLAAGRWQGELEVGSYLARIDAPGYYEESEPFEVREGEPTAVAVSLRPIPRASTATRGRTVVVPAPVPGYYGPRPFYAPYGPRVPRGPRVPAGPRVPRGPRLPGAPRPPLP